MAILLDINYGKKLGLPGYSSHTLGVGLRAEVANLDGVRREVQKAYELLQSAVDSQLINPGFIPGEQNSGEPRNGTPLDDPPGNGPDRLESDHEHTDPDKWQCSPKQKSLILDVLGRNNLPLSIVDTIAQHQHGKSMAGLDRLEASGVISEILERYGHRKGTADGNGGGAR